MPTPFLGFELRFSNMEAVQTADKGEATSEDHNILYGNISLEIMQIFYCIFYYR
jgi:hypothetical protein